MNANTATEARNDITNHLVNTYIGASDNDVEIIAARVEASAIKDEWYKVAPNTEPTYNERVQLGVSLGAKVWVENVRSEDIINPLIALGWRTLKERHEGWRLS